MHFKLFLSLIILTLTNNLYSQDILVEYSVLNSSQIMNCELIITDTISMFHTTKSQSVMYDDGPFLKNNNDGMVYFSERFLNVIFKVKDTLNIMKWELGSDTTTILGAKCLSATTGFRGRKYNAYYAPKYHLSDGPWKFGGLPGLILYVKSEDGYIEWKAIKIIENYSTKVQFSDIDKNKYVDWTGFVKKYIETVHKYVKLAKSNGTVPNGSTSKIKLETTEIFYPELQTGEGIIF